jgi:hypothetical protein
MLVTALLLAKSAAADPLPPGAPDLAGTWRLTLDVSTIADVSFLGQTTITSRQTMIAQVSRTAEGFHVHQDTCGLAARTRPTIAETSFPAAFVDAVPDKEYPLELRPEGAGWAVRMDLGPIAIGFDPATHPGFPSAVTDASVIDWDNDGKPAATIHVTLPIFGTFDIYQAQTSRAILDGTVLSADKLAGGAHIEDLRQRTLAATNRLFVQNPKLTSDPANSSFRMERAPGDARCSTEPAPRL